MPQVDFYILKHATEDQREFFACRLAEKAFNLGHTVYIQTDSEAAAQRMDDLLWSFKPEAYLPHVIQETMDPEDEDVPIIISYSEECTEPKDLLINLAHTVPVFYRAFPRISEIVLNNDLSRKSSRKHWRYYQEQGLELKHNEV